MDNWMMLLKVVQIPDTPPSFENRFLSNYNTFLGWFNFFVYEFDTFKMSSDITS